jgi:hypothetical protein
MPLVPPLPTDPPNLVFNPWFHQMTPTPDPTVQALDGWTDVSLEPGPDPISDPPGDLDGNVIGCMIDGTYHPWPDPALSAGTCMVYQPKTNTPCHPSGKYWYHGRLYQVVAADPNKKRLLMFYHTVGHKPVYDFFIVYGSNDEAGPWTEVWKPFENYHAERTVNEDGSTWPPPDYDNLLVKDIAQGYPYYKLSIEGQGGTGDGGSGTESASVHKFTGVYFAVTDSEEPGTIAQPVIGNVTNDHGSSRSAAAVGHNSDGELLLVSIKFLHGGSSTMPEVNSIKYNGLDLTPIDKAAVGHYYNSQTTTASYWFYLLNPPQGLTDLELEYNVTATRDVVTAISVQDADPVEPVGRCEWYKRQFRWGGTNSKDHMILRPNITRPKSRFIAAGVVVGASNGPMIVDPNTIEIVKGINGAGGSGMPYIVYYRDFAQPDSDYVNTGSTEAVTGFCLSGVEVRGKIIEEEIDVTASLALSADAIVEANVLIEETLYGN